MRRRGCRGRGVSCSCGRSVLVARCFARKTAPKACTRRLVRGARAFAAAPLVHHHEMHRPQLARRALRIRTLSGIPGAAFGRRPWRRSAPAGRRADVRASKKRTASRTRGYRGSHRTAAASAGPESWSWQVMPASPARNTALRRMGLKKLKPTTRPLSCDTSRHPAATAGMISPSPSHHMSPALMA